MFSLLEVVPLVMKAITVAVLVTKRPGRHAGVLAVLAFVGVADPVLWPWSMVGYTVENTVACGCIVLAAVDAVRRLPDRRLLLFQMACVAGSTWAAGEVLAHYFPPDTVRTMMVRVHFAAAAVAGVAAGTGRLDPVDNTALRWMFVTRVTLCAQLPLIGTAAYRVLGGVSTVAWAVACYLVVHLCLSSPGDDGARLPTPGPRPA